MPRLTWSAVTICAGTGSPVVAHRASNSGAVQEVTIVQVARPSCCAASSSSAQQPLGAGQGHDRSDVGDLERLDPGMGRGELVRIELGHQLGEDLAGRLPVLGVPELEIRPELSQQGVPGALHRGPRVDQGAIHVEQELRAQWERVAGGAAGRAGSEVAVMASRSHIAPEGRLRSPPW